MTDAPEAASADILRAAALLDEAAASFAEEVGGAPRLGELLEVLGWAVPDRHPGLAVAVATRVRDHGDAIRAEGFALHPLGWKRRGGGLLGHLRALMEIVRLYRQEQPDILYHVALKPVLFGGIAARIAFRRRARPAMLSAVMGLGTSAGAPWRRRVLGWALRFAASGNAGVLDLVAALQWVREHAARFGGDPGNVTIFGQSGGGGKVSALLGMPLAKGLFHKAVIQSGAGVRFAERERTTQLADAVLKQLTRCGARLECGFANHPRLGFG